MPAFKKWLNHSEKRIDPLVSQVFLLDMKRLDFDGFYSRIESHLSNHTSHQFMYDLLEVINKPTFLDLFKRKFYHRIRMKRRRKIFNCAEELLLDKDISYSLQLFHGAKEFISNRRFNLQLAQRLEALGRVDEAAEILQSFNGRFKHRSKDALAGRLKWWVQPSNNKPINSLLELGYDIDFLPAVSDYRPVKDRVLYHIHGSGFV